MHILAEALIPVYPSLTQLIEFSLIGFLVVMFVLSIQTIITALIGKIFIALSKNGK